MKKILAAILILFQILAADTIDISILFEQNATNEQTDRKLDEILEFLKKNPNKIDEEFDDDFKDTRAVYLFIFNPKVANTHKFDFGRIDQILAFNPDLNYDVFKFSSFKITLLDVAISINLSAITIDEDEILKLADKLISNGYDIKTPELLNAAYSIDSFKIFSYLLQNGAKNSNNVMTAIAVDFVKFISQNGYNIYAKEPASKAVREFAKEEKFINFYNQKMSYLDQMLKYVKLKDISDKDMEIFIKVNSYIDNASAIKFLLKNGLIAQDGSYEIIKKYAMQFDSKEILNLIKL